MANLRRGAHSLVFIAVVVVLCGASSAIGRRFFDDDPLAREPESQDASKVEDWDIELLTDLAINLFTPVPADAGSVRALNVNTIDEVPDSSWFTNRILARPLSLEQAAQGPLTSQGPAAGRWTVIAPKRAGAAPGFTMRDAAGELWFVSFDSNGYPEAASAAILVANKIFWTLGYFQVENHLVSVRRDQVEVAGSAKFTPLSGRTRPMRSHDLDEVFARSHRSPDGTYRGVAARGLPGRVVGGFRFAGTRPDDPNDVVPHEHRRELRALKVFGAWTNLVDMKAGNTLDTVITDGGRGIVRHYLQDVGSTFGTGATGFREYDEGWEYLVELDLIRKRLLRFGYPLLPWVDARYADNHAIGRFEGDAFDPPAWKPRVPTRALMYARYDDNFWAARRVAAFSDDMIRAIVKTGAYSNSADERLLADVLMQRRDKIARHYLNATNPLVDFALSADGKLTFRNAAVDAGVGVEPSGGYAITWASFDNNTGASTPVDSAAAGGPYLRARVAARGSVPERWTVPIEVYFRRIEEGGWRLVGVER
jgi:hypothetical protein